MKKALENIAVFFFCIGFLVWVVWLPASVGLVIWAVIKRKWLVAGLCEGAILLWLLFTIWFKKTDPKRVAKKKAAQRALHATYYEGVSLTYGLMRFEHIDTENGSWLISEHPPLFNGTTEYKLYIRRAVPDIVFVTKQLKWLDGMYDMINEKMLDRLEYVCGYRGLPLSCRPEGYNITSISLPESKKEDIMLYGFFIGINERYAGEAILHIGERGVQCTIDTGRDDDFE